MSPKARDTDMSPHMRPSTIYKKKQYISTSLKQESASQRHVNKLNKATAKHEQFSILVSIVIT